MDKKVLNEYPNLIKEADKISKRLEKLRKQSSIVSDVVQNGYKRHAIIEGIDIIRQKKIRDLEDLLLDREAKIIIQQYQIEKFITEIDKSELRQIYEHRYIDGMNWIQIQIAMEFDSEDVARKKHDRYFEKIKEI